LFKRQSIFRIISKDESSEGDDDDLQHHDDAEEDAEHGVLGDSLEDVDLNGMGGTY
jgi:hypothetical protein